MPKQRAIKFYLDNTFEEGSFHVDANHLKDGKDTVNFLPINVFTERKSKLKFYRAPRKLLMFVDGCVNAVKWSGKLLDLQLAWTKKEAEEDLKKELAKAHAEQHIIKTWHFVALFIPTVIILLLLVRLAMMWGAFS